MAGKKISELTPVTPLLTDLLPLDRPTTGPGAPVTGKATLTAIQALIGGTGGGNDYWESTTSGEIFATGSLAAVTGSFLASFLSSSNGSEITGSLLINVEGLNDGHGLIISASTNNSSRALEIVDVANSATIFSVDHNTSKVKVDSIINPNQSIALNAVQGFGAGHIEIKVDTASSPTGSITVIDETSNFSNLNLEIAALEFNGEKGIAGYVLTSSTPNAPGWAPISSLVTPQPEYWLSTVNEAVYTTGSALFSGPGGVGVDSPALLGTDMFFFVSGAIGSKDTAVTGTAVFGGDVVISGTLHGGSPLKIGSGVVVTGSATFKVDEPGQSVIISGSTNSGARALDVVDASPGQEYSVFYIDPGNANVTVGTQDPSNYITLANGSTYPKVSVISGSNRIELSPTINRISVKVLDTLPTASIRVEDQSESSANLDLQIASLQINGDAGAAGYVLTSSAPNAPGWASINSLVTSQPAYWTSTQTSGLYTTGSALFRGPAGTNDSPSDFGTDTFFYVSGSISSKGTAVTGTAVFGGDLHVSGNITSDGNATVSQLISVGQNLQVAGILAVTGSSYLIGSITGSGGLLLTGSTVLAGNGGVSVGSDTVFFVSGANEGNAKAVFGGDLHVSGNIELENGISLQARNTAGTLYVDIIGVSDGTTVPGLGLGSDVIVLGDNGNTTGILFQDSAELIALITGSNQGYFSGSYKFPQGISGSLTKLTDGSSYLVAGTGIQITTNSNGSVTINQAGEALAVYWSSSTANQIFTTSSLTQMQTLSASNGAIITGSVAVGTFAIASAVDSFSQGTNTLASFQGAHAQGLFTTASAVYAHAEGDRSRATGQYSHAEGSGSLASGKYSHAEGNATLASFNYAHAEGWITTASNNASHAEGYFTQAIALASHAEGDTTVAAAQVSHAEGFKTLTETGATWSHAEGYFTTASAFASHAEGERTFAGPLTGYASHAEGYGSYTSASYSHAEGFSTLTEGSYSHAEGGRTRTLLGAVYAHTEGHLTTASAAYSHAEGHLTFASGSYSHAEGFTTLTSGSYSHAEGDRTVARGDYTHTEGRLTLAVGPGSHAEGYLTTASNASFGFCHSEGDSTQATGYASHAEGYLTVAGTNNFAHAEGHQTTAAGYASHAEGYQSSTSAASNYGHAEGRNVSVTGDSAHGEGQSTRATGFASHAEGYFTLASGYAAHAQGYFSTGSGNYSNASGYFTDASGPYSHTAGLATRAYASGSVAFGNSAEAVGIASFAAGTTTIASGSGQVVVGKNNIRDNNFSLFVIGDGTGTSNTLRSDIVRVNSGTLPGSGSFEVTGTVRSTLGFSGSLTQLTDGTPYLIAGTNIQISTGALGAVTISSLPNNVVKDRETSTNFTITSVDQFIRVSAASTGTLPNPALSGSFVIKKTGTGTYTINVSGSYGETIDGQTYTSAGFTLSGSFATDRPAWTMWSDGTNWWIA